MLAQVFRDSLQRRLIDPVAWVVGRYITPTQMTLAGLLTGALAAYLLAGGRTGLAVVSLLASGVFDCLDGSVARLYERVTPFGAALDICADRVVEFAIVVGLFWVEPGLRGGACLLMLGSILLCVTSFLVVGILVPNTGSKGFYYSPGLVERPEAFGFFLAMMLWPSYFQPLAWSFTVLVLFTAGWRLWQYYRHSGLSHTQ
jgi:phosphatidylglycerophosphate synthase